MHNCTFLVDTKKYEDINTKENLNKTLDFGQLTLRVSAVILTVLAQIVQLNKKEEFFWST